MISTGVAVVFWMPMAAAAALLSVTDFWLREMIAPPGESFALS